MNAIFKTVLGTLGAAIFAIAGAIVLMHLSGDMPPSAFAIAAATYIAMWVGGGVGFVNMLAACFVRQWQINRAVLFAVFGAISTLLFSLFLLPGESALTFVAFAALGAWTGLGSWLGFRLGQAMKRSR